jgi:hypothetical protein
LIRVQSVFLRGAIVRFDIYNFDGFLTNSFLSIIFVISKTLVILLNFFIYLNFTSSQKILVFLQNLLATMGYICVIHTPRSYLIKTFIMIYYSWWLFSRIIDVSVTRII